MITFDRFWLLLVTLGHFWSLLVTFGRFWSLLVIFTHFWGEKKKKFGRFSGDPEFLEITGHGMSEPTIDDHLSLLVLSES